MEGHRIIKTLRYVTALVQLMPFVYSILFIVSLIVGLFAKDSIVTVFDMLFYVSPITIISFLLLSRLLKMCKWHKTACVLPLFPQAVTYFDYYIYQIPTSSLTIMIATIASMTTILIISAYKTFIR